MFQFLAGVLEFPSDSVVQLIYLISGNLSILGGLFPCGQRRLEYKADHPTAHSSHIENV
jgi:hypothetical protein